MLQMSGQQENVSKNICLAQRSQWLLDKILCIHIYTLWKVKSVQIWPKTICHHFVNIEVETIALQIIADSGISRSSIFHQKPLKETRGFRSTGLWYINGITGYRT